MRKRKRKREERRDLHDSIGSMKENFSTCLFLNTTKSKKERKRIRRKKEEEFGKKRIPQQRFSFHCFSISVQWDGVV